MAKMEITVRITDDDGKIIEKTIDTGKEIPGSQDFDLTNEQRFLTTFDKLEKVTLETRDEAVKTTLEEFLRKSVKKN